MSEWVELYDTEVKSVVHVNLDQAGSIYPVERDGEETKAEIWFMEHPGEPKLGRIRVSQTPAQIFKLLRGN